MVQLVGSKKHSRHSKKKKKEGCNKIALNVYNFLDNDNIYIWRLHQLIFALETIETTSQHMQGMMHFGFHTHITEKQCYS